MSHDKISLELRLFLQKVLIKAAIKIIGCIHEILSLNPNLGGFFSGSFCGRCVKLLPRLISC